MGVVGFFLPTILMLVDGAIEFATPQVHIPGVFLYVPLAAAAIVCATIISTATFPWQRKIVLILVVWCLIVLQVLTLGVPAIMTGGLSDTQ